MKNLLRLLVIFLFFVPSTVLAQDDRWYQYNRIDTTISVNRDTSFDVSETVNYLFNGEYHQGYREIPFRKVDAVTNIKVLDESGKPLTYSNRRLEKTNRSSWGKYTTFVSNNSQVIEWYYDAKDEKRAWRLEYRVEGGLEFLKDADRLYWNLFTNYSVPVVRASVRIVPPEGATFDSLDAYRTTAGKQITKTEETDGPATFFSSDFDPQEAFTVDVQWPKGFIDRGAYWRTFIRLYYGYIGAATLLLLSIATGFLSWLIHEKLPQSRLTTVPQYKPPKNLRPAVAEVVTKEILTPKGLAATIVDLAVRGYVKIEEIPRSWFSFGKNYKVIKTKDLDTQKTAEYERQYIRLLMKGHDSFTTDGLKHSKDTSLHRSIQKIKDDIYSHTQVETKAFAVSPLEEKKKWLMWGLLLFIVFLLVGYTAGLRSQLMILIESMIVSGAGLFAFLKFEARLTREGMVLKDEWLGFKMFLETAEKGEHERATPDLFPAYLPYAMVFGVEKKWAKAFDGMNIPNQTWYVGRGHYSGGVGGGFSGFSASFSSSFASAFASSAGGGSSGGGGSAGGGGGGGGGGAS